MAATIRFGRDYFNFRPPDVVKALLSSSTPYKGYREVLFAGLCAWMLASQKATAQASRRKFIERAIRSRAMQIYLNRCEQLAFSDPTPSQQDTWTKEDLKQFKERVFTPLKVAKLADRPGILRKSLEAQRNKLGPVLELVGLWHFLIAEGRVGPPPQRSKIAISVSASVLSELGIPNDIGVRVKTESSRNVERAWEEFSRSAAFTYAASTLPVPRRGVLLDRIGENAVTWAEVKSIFPKWIARAHYIESEVFSKLARGKKKDRFPDLSNLDISAEPPPKPSFSKSEIAHILTAYSQS